ALTGEPERALRMLQTLLRDEQQVLDARDQRLIALRRQIGLLQRGLGQREEARRTLSGLVDDLIRWNGPAHPMVGELRAQLDALARSGQPSPTTV
ncbi:MAG: serine/threonine protein kinase, partial [Actinobacteria bacterium]